VVPVGGDLSCEKVSGTGGAGGRTAAVAGSVAGTTAATDGAARLPVRWIGSSAGIVGSISWSMFRIYECFNNKQNNKSRRGVSESDENAENT
jgi:hypothetical protein